MKKLPVPLLKQTRQACGPTALAMVLKYFKKEIPLRKIVRAVGGVKGFGVRTTTLAKYARRLGFKVYCYSFNKKLSGNEATIIPPHPDLIPKFLNRHIPVIITVRESLLYHTKPNRSGHFIVITSFQKGEFRYNDPTTGKSATIKTNDLLFAWYNNVLDSSAYLLAIEPR